MTRPKVSWRLLVLFSLLALAPAAGQETLTEYISRTHGAGWVPLIEVDPPVKTEGLISFTLLPPVIPNQRGPMLCAPSMSFLRIGYDFSPYEIVSAKLKVLGAEDREWRGPTWPAIGTPLHDTLFAQYQAEEAQIAIFGGEHSSLMQEYYGLKYDGDGLTDEDLYYLYPLRYGEDPPLEVPGPLHTHLVDTYTAFEAQNTLYGLSSSDLPSVPGTIWPTTGP